ncbi:MAG: DNA mismatch repair endonuclease MutL [Planctomycetales bacterium]|nr:DNA mismatch repair endonuclease MutL [Planctomycetales bacterium]
MPIIRQLPPSVINKIAAGEVIERPSSVVKELVENSVDAGATRVDVAIEGGGSTLVRVADNGCGISAEQLVLAVASHATSKISDADDLFSVRSLGFRGEALASIAEISHFQIRSRQSDDEAGAEMEVIGGEIRPLAPCGAPVGTTIEVRNLFFNTPVRRKFLRTTQTEMGHAIEAFTRIALAFPDVHFTFAHNGRTLHDLPPISDWRERIAKLFDADLAGALIDIEGQDGDVTLRGLVADPSHSRGSNRMQYVFLNGRHIRDRALQHALGEAYRGLLMTGRFPIAFLQLNMPPEMVDVNVHPTKLEVRFQDGSRLYSVLLGSLRRKFLSTDMTARVGKADAEQAAGNSAAGGSGPNAAGSRVDAAHAADSELSDWARRQLPGGSNTATAGSQQARLALQYAANPRGIPPFKPFDDGRLTFAPSQTTAVAPPGDSTHAAPATARLPGEATVDRGGERSSTAPRGDYDLVDLPDLPPVPTSHAASASAPTTTPATTAVHPELELSGLASAEFSTTTATGSAASPAACQTGIQLHNRYLITENSQGILVVDQHALHERVIYEQIRDKVLGGAIEKQRLLVPEPVTLLPAEAAAVLEARETLAQIGIDVEPFGGDTVLVTGYPAMLANLNPAELLRQIVDQLMSEGKTPDARDVIDELLHMISCKAAIKAGDRLSPEEVSALLEQRHLFHDTHHCPHGRPTALLFTKEELDKRFKRI